MKDKGRVERDGKLGKGGGGRVRLREPSPGTAEKLKTNNDAKSLSEAFADTQNDSLFEQIRGKDREERRKKWEVGERLSGERN
jgi:hypothetical protein